MKLNELFMDGKYNSIMDKASVRVGLIAVVFSAWLFTAVSLLKL